MQLAVEVASYDADVAANVPWLDIAGVRDDDAGTLTFFAINRNGTEQAYALAIQNATKRPCNGSARVGSSREACSKACSATPPFTRNCCTP